jgi:hypothetical protein
MLSQGPMATRPLPAGPMTPMEGPQSQGPAVARFALHVGGRDPYAVADDVLVPLLVTRGGGEGAPRAEAGQLLAVEGAEVSAVTREGGALHVRCFNPTDEAVTVRLPDHRGWLLDLRGRPQQPFEGSFELAPWQITTAVLACSAQA